MKLAEKIVACRKRTGLSQDALAEQVGVSRQAVSKWETGTAVPEVGKLLQLARAFGVTTDWLLSEDDAPGAAQAPEPAPEPAAPGSAQTAEPTPEPTPATPPEQPAPLAASITPPERTWVDAIPGVIGKLIRRYGWLYGVYTALGGLGFLVFGWLGKTMFRQMAGMDSLGLSGMNVEGLPSELFSASTTWYDEAGNVVASPFADSTPFGGQSVFTTANPVDTLATVILVIGAVLLVAGVILAICLKVRDKEQD